MTKPTIDPYLEELLKANGYYGNTEEDILEEPEEEDVMEEPEIKEPVTSDPSITLHMMSKNDHYLKQMKLYRNSGIMSGIMCLGSLLSYTYTLPMDSTPSAGMLKSITIGMSALALARTAYCFHKRSDYSGKCVKKKEENIVKNKIKEKVNKW